MRRRLFWTIVGVSAVTGLLVLSGAVVASQRAAVNATFREMSKSLDEAVLIIEETAERAGENPAITRELLRVFDSELGPAFGRIRRTAGGSAIAFGFVGPDGELRATSELFAQVQLDVELLKSGGTQFARTDSGALVAIESADIGQPVLVLVALAREAPVLRLGDQTAGLLIVIVGMAVISAVLARVLSSRVSRQLEPLAAASRELADGDMSVRVPDLGDPELDGVAAAFNDMASELESAREREREFILGVGHDLRTPLTTIGGYAEALETGDVSPAEIERIGAVLGVQSRQLSRLIEDLSTLARLEQPEFSLRREEVDVAAHVAEIVEGFRRQASEYGVSLAVHAPAPVIVETDPDRVGQIAQNLLENALRFTPETGAVDVSVEPVEGGVRIAVSDTGTGIAEEDLPFVFDRHFVGTQRRVRNEGTGLGLSIVQGLVERLGGNVEAQSRLGRGTTIVVTLEG